jgi:S1-C subfamily serine protease
MLKVQPKRKAKSGKSSGSTPPSRVLRQTDKLGKTRKKPAASRKVAKAKPSYNWHKIILGGLLGVVFAASVYLALDFFQVEQTNNVLSVASVVRTVSSCDKNRIIANLEKCSVAIGSDNYHFGSGFVIKNGLVLTAAHVVSGAETLYVTQGENSVLAELVATSANLDLALLKLTNNSLGFEPCIINEEGNLAPLTALYATGWPYGSLDGGVSFTNGHLSRYWESSGSSYLQIDINTLPGNSGGPVANDCGVVGINTFRLTFENDEEDATAVYQGFDMALPSKNFMEWVRAQI